MLAIQGLQGQTRSKLSRLCFKTLHLAAFQKGYVPVDYFKRLLQALRRPSLR